MPSEAYAGKPRDGLGICEVAAKFLEEEGSQDTLVLGSLALRWQTDAVKCEPLPALVAWLAFVGGWVFFFFVLFQGFFGLFVWSSLLVFVRPLFKFLLLPDYWSHL